MGERMKLIIAGTRDMTLEPVFIQLLMSYFDIPEPHLVVSGGAKGIDKSGEEWAKARGIPIELFVPNWDKHGRKAGPLRNQEMAAHADALLLIWDGMSRGSLSMRQAMWDAKKPVYEVTLRKS